MIGVAIALSLACGPPTAPAMASGAARQACAGGVFTRTFRQGTLAPSPSPTVRRLRRVEIDVDRLFPGGGPPAAARAADVLTLNLFPDVCVTADREQVTDVGPGRVQWVGRVAGVPNGRAILVIDDRVMVGTVTIDRAVFQIGALGDDVHVVSELVPAAFPRD
jgi:hypothetical protein